MVELNFTDNISKVIFLMGPTSSGKTALAIELRKILPVEIISVDSALIYRQMDIGTGKLSHEELKLTPHRLLNIKDPSEIYSVAEFYHDALIEIKNIIKIKRIPLLVGGTMLYFKVLLEGLSNLPSSNPYIREKIKQIVNHDNESLFLYDKLHQIDPKYAKLIHPNDSQRILRALEICFISGKTVTELKKKPVKKLPYNVYQFVITTINRNLLHHQIMLRFKKMLLSGFELEVRNLFLRGDLHKNMPSMRCVGYRQMWSYLSGEINYNEMVFQSISATKQLAKRQLTWLNNWKNTIWLKNESIKLSCDAILSILNNN